jgi:hypothetical protein
MGEKTVSAGQKYPFIEALHKLQKDTRTAGFAGNDDPFDMVLSAHALHAALEMIRTGPDARVHHKPGTVFEMAALFLAWSGELPMEDSAKLDDEWCKAAVAEALEQHHAPVAAEGSQAEDKFWDAVKEVAKSG